MSRFEIEQKYRIRNPQVVRTQLKRMRARKIRKGFESNELFDLDGFIRRHGCVIRLRKYGGKTLLTFKGPRQKGNVKKRVEIESLVPYQTTRSILRQMGFRITFRYEKIREIYHWRGTEIVLDHLSRHGWFLEIEGTEKGIRQAADKLGLKKKHIELRTYREILGSGA